MPSKRNLVKENGEQYQENLWETIQEELLLKPIKTTEKILGATSVEIPEITPEDALCEIFRERLGEIPGRTPEKNPEWMPKRNLKNKSGGIPGDTLREILRQHQRNIVRVGSVEILEKKSYCSFFEKTQVDLFEKSRERLSLCEKSCEIPLKNFRCILLVPFMQKTLYKDFSRNIVRVFFPYFLIDTYLKAFQDFSKKILPFYANFLFVFHL